MAHFAQLGSDGTTVMQVIAVNNEAIDGGDFPQSEEIGQQFISQRLGLPGTWLQCSFSGSFRSAFPGEGWKWTGLAFVPPVGESVSPVADAPAE